MPAYSDAPLPVGLDALVGMGMNRVKLAIAVALAEHGGTLSPDPPVSWRVWAWHGAR